MSFILVVPGFLRNIVAPLCFCCRPDGGGYHRTWCHGRPSFWINKLEKLQAVVMQQKYTNSYTTPLSPIQFYPWKSSLGRVYGKQFFLGSFSCSYGQALWEQSYLLRTCQGKIAHPYRLGYCLKLFLSDNTFAVFKTFLMHCLWCRVTWSNV